MRRRATRAIVIAFAAIMAMALVARMEIRAQAPATGRGSAVLMGVIVDALDNRPIVNAEVTLGGAPPAVANTQQLTDADGQFVFLDLPKGTFTITAKKAGYADGAFGRRRQAGLSQTLTLTDGERFGDLKIPIWSARRSPERFVTKPASRWSSRPCACSRARWSPANGS